MLVLICWLGFRQVYDLLNCKCWLHSLKHVVFVACLESAAILDSGFCYCAALGSIAVVIRSAEI